MCIATMSRIRHTEDITRIVQRTMLRHVVEERARLDGAVDDDADGVAGKGVVRVVTEDAGGSRETDWLPCAHGGANMKAIEGVMDRAEIRLSVNARVGGWQTRDHFRQERMAT